MSIQSSGDLIPFSWYLKIVVSSFHRKIIEMFAVGHHEVSVILPDLNVAVFAITVLFKCVLCLYDSACPVI